MNINKKYVELLQEIYYRGFTYEDPNRKGVKRKQIPFYRFEHNFEEDGYPIIGVKQTYPKMAFNEMLAFMRGYTHLKELESLGVTFWRKDAYNFYLRKCDKNNVEHRLSFEKFLEESMFYTYVPEIPDYVFGNLGKIYSYQIRNWDGKVDQLNEVLERIKNNSKVTKNIVNMWNPSDMKDCALSPCHRSFEFIVEGDGLYVQWEQGSVDTFLGLPMNILYYSDVCYIFAHYLGLKPKGIIGNLSNVHLYDNSFDAVEKVLNKVFVDVCKNQESNILNNIVESKWNLPEKWENLDDYLNQLDFKTNLKIVGYKHLGREDVEMLAYS